MQSSFLPPSLLDIYTLSMSSLGCNALCMIISFLDLWSVGFSSYLALFKNGPENLTRGQPWYLSLWQGSCNKVLSRGIFWLFLLYCHLQHHNDTIIKTQEDFFKKIFTSHFIARVRKGLLKVCVWEGAGDRTETAISDPTLMAVNVVSFSFSWCSTGGPGGHSPGWWLSLLYLISNFSGPQSPSGFPRATTRL